MKSALPLLILIAACFVGGDIIGNELTMRSFDSVDIQVCADNILSSEQKDLRDAILVRLQEMLASTAVYFTRIYTKAATGTVCYMFVFQARNPDQVREGVQIVTGDTSVLQVTFGGMSLACNIMAVPWMGEESGPLGLSWQFTTGDVLVWGGIMGGVLAGCAVAVCCYVQLSANKERKRASELLAKDSQLLAKFGVVKAKKGHKATKKPHTSKEEEEA